MNPSKKYQQFHSVSLPNRTWPGKVITKAPVWCSVDLRDGNQSLVNPMGIEQKLEFFDKLVKIGFKEIEVGFPSSNDTEFKFIRRLIEENHVPNDVTLQVLCQARDHLVKKTFESLKGLDHAIFHLYNATSPATRKYIFNKSKEEVITLAVDGVKCVKRCIKEMNAENTANGQPEIKIQLEYSPEHFSTTEIDYALEICEAVKNEWFSDEKSMSADKSTTTDKSNDAEKSAKSHYDKIILNLPTTVECSLPNQFADQIEYFCNRISDRENVIISLHNHNDRGEGVAQCELGLLAGADRVEGCLFGNGERTGNVDIITAALNMYTQGVDPKLDFSNLEKLSRDYERLTDMPIHPRAPYAGELVYTAFSGSHQDAISKAMAARENKAEQPEKLLWDVPYLPIDPHDIGRHYQGIIRINSQSGKGGAAFVLEHDYGIIFPKAMHPILGAIIKKNADSLQRELSSKEVYDIFEKTWLKTKSPLNVIVISERHIEGARGEIEDAEQVACMANVEWLGNRYAISATGNGPLDAFVKALKQTPAPDFTLISFHEHSIGTGADTSALAYVQIAVEKKSGGRTAVKNNFGKDAMKNAKKDETDDTMTNAPHSGNDFSNTVSTEKCTTIWGVGKSSNVGRAGIAAVVSAINFMDAWATI